MKEVTIPCETLTLAPSRITIAVTCPTIDGAPRGLSDISRNAIERQHLGHRLLEFDGPTQDVNVWFENPTYEATWEVDDSQYDGEQAMVEHYTACTRMLFRHVVWQVPKVLP